MDSKQSRNCGESDPSRLTDPSQLGVFVGARDQEGGEEGDGGGLPPDDLRTQLLALKQQQHIQQQMLLQNFHEQQVRMAAEHEKQIQEHVKVANASLQVLMAQKQQQEIFEAQQHLHEQQVMEKERQEIERQEKEKLQLIKNKNKNEQSANASSAVKMKLQEFVLNKKHRESHGGSLSNSPPQFRHWSAQHRSLDQHSPPQSGLSPPYRHHHVLGHYEKDFPLRKTASEPNLKVRLALKQKMIEKRGSPLLRRKDKLFKRNPVSSRKCFLAGADGPEAATGDI